MKRYSIILTVLILAIFVFAACKNETESGAETELDGKKTEEVRIADDEQEQETDNPRNEGVVEAFEDESGLPFSGTKYFMFSSGAGAWRTEITLDANGNFEGLFSDAEMGSSDESYPDGTVYIAEFTGRFTDIKKIDETSYSMKLGAIEYAYDPGAVWVEDGVRYIAADAYGIDPGEEFVFYLPDTSVDGLSEEFLLWWPHRYGNEDMEFLGEYGIYNKTGEYGFFTVE